MLILLKVSKLEGKKVCLHGLIFVVADFLTIVLSNFQSMIQEEITLYKIFF